MKGVAKDSDMITEDGTKGQRTTVRKGRRLCGGRTVHTVKKLAIFPSHPAGLSLTKLSLAGNNLIFPDQGEFGK
jgi:hypothetical protein